MLETAAVSILTQAADFLFEQGRKILEERRQRRQAERQEAGEAPPEPVAAGEPLLAGEAVPDEAIQSKQELLAQEVSRQRWAAYEEQVRHLVSLLKIQSRNYQLAREQYAKWGSALVPPIIVHNLEEAEDAVAGTMAELRATLAQVYDQEIVVPEPEGDGEG